jgi:hypothetical protein
MEEKFKTRSELASALGIDRKTFGQKVEKVGIILRPRERISPALQKEIKERLVDKTTTTTTLPITPHNTTNE